MKILYFCNYFQPMNYGENEISRSLKALGHKVTIVTGDRYFPFPNYSDTVEKILGPRQQAVGSQKTNGIEVVRNKIVAEFAARAVFFGVKTAIEKYKPNIILVSGLSTPVAVQVALFKPAKTRLIFIDSHLPSELNSGEQISKKAFYFVFRLLFSGLINKKADKIIAVQEATVDVIRDTYGIDKPVEVISHGTDKELFSFSAVDRKAQRQKLGIPSDDITVITTGKIIPAKGVELLFQACAVLFKQHPQLHLLVVGNGPEDYKTKCLNHIPNKYRARVDLTGFQPQSTLPAYYSASDIAVWPLQESLAMNDAMSCGLPLIVNDQIGVKERISNNNALQYMQGDDNDLEQKIKYLIDHPDERQAMGRRGRELVEEKMSWMQKAKEYIS